jgi:hypothetical protein
MTAIFFTKSLPLELHIITYLSRQAEISQLRLYGTFITRTYDAVRYIIMPCESSCVETTYYFQ